MSNALTRTLRSYAPLSTRLIALVHQRNVLNCNSQGGWLAVVDIWKRAACLLRSQHASSQRRARSWGTSIINWRYHPASTHVPYTTRQRIKTPIACWVKYQQYPRELHWQNNWALKPIKELVMKNECGFFLNKYSTEISAENPKKQLDTVLQRYWDDQSCQSSLSLL